jgi:hypothetical protein
MDPVYRFSGVGRPVDPSYATNRAIILLALLAFVGGTARAIMGASEWLDASFLGANAALTVFLAWALTRELAPDDEAGAFGAVALVGIAWFTLGRQSLLIPALLMLALRIVNRSTGKAAEPTDTLFVAPFFGLVAWSVSWTLGLVGAAAFALDAGLPGAPGQPRRRYHWGVAVALLAVTGARLLGGTPGIRLPDAPLVFLVITGMALLAGFAYPSPRSVGDVDGAPLVDTRVRSGFLLGVAATVLLTLDAGVGTGSLAVLWCSLGAAAVGLPFLLARRRT